MNRQAALATCLISAATAHAERFDSAGVSIHYDTAGPDSDAAPLVVFIHGYTRSAADWVGSPIWNTLATDHRVVALDTRGHGRSDKPVGAEHYGDACIEDILRLLDHLGAERADLVGYSMGGGIALRTATLQPDRVRRIVVGGFGWDPEFDKTQDATVARVTADLRSGEGFAELFRAMEVPGRDPFTADDVEAMERETFAVAPPEVWASAFEGTLAWNYTREQLEACPVPALFIAGDLDALAIAARTASTRMPNASLVLIANADHIQAGGDPLFATSATAFLKAD